jgi:hypothetical protein
MRFAVSAGFGLNLAEADYCFLLNPWWNPATEAQAVDRAHRIAASSLATNEVLRCCRCRSSSRYIAKPSMSPARW